MPAERFVRAGLFLRAALLADGSSRRFRGEVRETQPLGSRPRRAEPRSGRRALVEPERPAASLISRLFCLAGQSRGFFYDFHVPETRRTHRDRAERSAGGAAPAVDPGRRPSRPPRDRRAPLEPLDAISARFLGPAPSPRPPPSRHRGAGPSVGPPPRPAPPPPPARRPPSTPQSRQPRAFKKFRYRGVDLDKLLELKTDELVALLPARVRRKFARGLPQGAHTLVKRIRAAKRAAPAGEKPAPVRTHLRSMVVLPEFIGAVVGIYNGRAFNQVEIRPEMVGHYLGELSITYKPVAHGRPGMLAQMAKFIPMK